MQYYQCKCGQCQSWGSLSPAQCRRCPKCKSNVASGPNTHSEPEPHSYQATQVETDNGPQPLSRCVWCLGTKAEIEWDETPKVLGIDIGNVIKKVGQEGVLWGFFDALKELKEGMFDDRVFIISRVYDDEHAAKSRQWLKDNGVIAPGVIADENVFYCFERHEKAPIAERLKITHFVDDRTEVLSHMKTVRRRVAFNPSEQQLKDFPPTEMKVVTHWYEVAGHILRNR